MERHWYWDRYIDTDHPDLYLLGEEPGRGAVTGKDRDTVPVFMFVNQIDCFLKSSRANQSEDGAEYFFAIDPHTRANPIKKGSGQEKSFRRNVSIPSIHNQVGSFLLTQIEVRSNPFQMGSGY
jgi:hypothetical protein